MKSYSFVDDRRSNLTAESSPEARAERRLESEERNMQACWSVRLRASERHNSGGKEAVNMTSRSKRKRFGDDSL